MTTLKRLLLLVPLLLLLVPASASSASAATQPAPGWRIDSFATPTEFSAARNAPCVENGLGTQIECDDYEVVATNAGAKATEGTVVMTDEVPPGLEVRQAVLEFINAVGTIEEIESACSTTGRTVRCEYPGVVEPDQKLNIVVEVTVQGSPGALAPNKVSVSGGGAATVEQAVANEISEAPAPFGFSSFDFFIDSLSGTPDTQAGDHPYELTATIDLHSKFRESPEGKVESTSVEDVKDILVDLPVGFVGSILAAPQCTFAQLVSQHHCPADTRIGYLHTFPQQSATHAASYIYNVTPERGVPAEFGYIDALKGAHTFYVHVVPTAKGYVLQSSNIEIPQIALDKIIATFWGDPALRDASSNPEIPFFTNPTDCTGEAPTATIYMDSWNHPAALNPNGTPVNLAEPQWVTDESSSPPVTGCNALQFTPELGAQPTTREADKPSGLNFELKVPQTEEVGVPSTPTLKSVEVTLPEGFTVDPSAGDGLAACSEEQIGWAGNNPAGSAPGELQDFNANAPACPEASKIGTLELESPLVPHPLKGELFLASQNANPFGSTLAAYVVVDDPITGVLIKIAGEFLPDPSTGRLTALFAENPNLPFSDLKLAFFGGPRAELATPEACGTFTTTTELAPYSLEAGELPASPFDDFVIDEACPNGGFDPSFAALSSNVQAGAYTPFLVSFQRQDTDQELAGLSVTLPPGLLADVGSVPLCGDAQASAGTCPESTQVGTVETTVGPGPNPLQVAGHAYLTGPYNGGPYGLSVVVSAVAGPYNFGTVVVRQSIRINPYTAQVTDVSDPFPTIIDGIPLRLRRVDVTLNRPGFTFNPTSCAKLAFDGTISGSPLGSPRTLNGTIGYATQAGAVAPFTAPFQATNCTSLKFQPKFTVSTTGHTSKALGASLTAKLTYPKLPQGSEANIARVKVDLPKQLPSQLKTLQKACTAKQFELNPANCPKESKIGYATVSTPILALPLSGPAIFVSHGNEAFPSLTMVLQGDGVTIDLVGSTLIKNGITSTTFKTVPDTPFSSFELKLAQGKYAALNSNLPEKDHGNLCGQNLKMPTEFVAQNGAKINQSTPISVTGCKKVVKNTKKHTGKKRG